MRRLSLILVCAGGILALSLALGCGGDNGPTGPASKQVSGLVTKAPVSGAIVSVFAINTNGRPGARAAGPVNTASDGTWTVSVPTNQGDDLLVVSTGGAYTDEATGHAESFGGEDQLTGRLDLRSGTPFVVVSPFTQALDGAARARIATGTGVREAWDDVTAEMLLALGFDATRTIPATGDGATDGEKRYAAFLGGISTLVHDDALLAAAVTESGMGQIIVLLADDFSDGILDGRDAQGNALRRAVPGGTDEGFPGIDTEGVKPLAAATKTYASANVPGLDPSRIPDDPTLFPGGGGCGNLDLLRARAYASLEDQLYPLLNDLYVQRPADIDLTEPRDFYAQVLTCEPDDPEANLALAILDLAALFADDEVNAAFDEWDSYLSDYLPFEHGASKGLARVTPSLPAGSGALALPLALIQRNLFLAAMEPQAGVPEISRTQNILKNKVLPLAASGLDHLEKVLAAPTFEFTISPRMQGDEYEDPVTADRTDFLALRAALHGLRAGCYAAMAYDADLPAYDGSSVTAGLNQNSGSLGKLRSGGQSYMQSVPSELVAAADDVDAAITSLLAEPGGTAQTHDLIKIGPDGLNRSDLEDFQNNDLPDIRAAFLGPVTRTEDWDGNSSTPDAPLTINLAAFFGTPVQDWKKMVPPYTVSLETVPYDESYFYHDGTLTGAVTAPSAGSYSANCSVYYYNGREDYSYCSGPAWLTSTLQSLADQRISAIQAIPNWSGYLDVYVTYSGNFAEGTQSITVDYSEGYEIADRMVDIPVLTFSANTYAQWAGQFPSATVNGLFPGIQNVDQLAQLFGIETDGWNKALRLDWTNGVEFAPPATKPAHRSAP